MKRKLLAAAVAIAIIAFITVFALNRNVPTAPPESLGDLLAAVENGKDSACESARQLLSRDWPGQQGMVLQMLQAPSANLRLLATQVLARQQNPCLPELLARCSDSDWRVRSAAFEALWRIKPSGQPLPPRDTPLDQREKLLLAWLDQLPAENRPPGSVGDLLCQAHAMRPNIEVGPEMVQRCLQCHVGPSERRGISGGQCARCHQELSAQWGNSAHANSLSHLALVTVDPQTRTAGRVNFGQLEGIQCAQCHADRRQASASEATSPGKQGFTSQGSRQACRQCHLPTWDQWQKWQQQPHARRLTWPPGQVELTKSDARGCVDCHMVRNSQTRDHRWAARRDVDLLEQGLDLKAGVRTDPAGKQALHLEIVNLAGHEYPTGWPGRGLAVVVGFDAQPPEIVALLSPQVAGKIAPASQPALAIGESRAIDVAVPPAPPGQGAGNRTATCRLIYYRDIWQPERYSAVILEREIPLTPARP